MGEGKRNKDYFAIEAKHLIMKCLNEVKDKINLEFYNTPGVVRDYDQVGEWMGIEQLHLPKLYLET